MISFNINDFEFDGTHTLTNKETCYYFIIKRETQKAVYGRHYETGMKFINAIAYNINTKEIFLECQFYCSMEYRDIILFPEEKEKLEKILKELVEIEKN